jgi:hypothetical protein
LSRGAAASARSCRRARRRWSGRCLVIAQLAGEQSPELVPSSLQKSSDGVRSGQHRP